MVAIRNITVSDIDTNGRALIGSDNVKSVFVYDSSGEVWVKDYNAIAQPVVDPNFLVNISGTSSPWLNASDELVSGSYCISTSKTLFAGTNDLIRSAVSTSTQSTSYFYTAIATRLTRWPAWDDAISYTNWPWAATASTGWVKHDFGTPQTFDELMFEWRSMTGQPGVPETASTGIKGWHLDVSDNDSLYTTVASGTAYENQVEPVFIDLPETSARYVKFYVDSNWGGVRCNLSELALYQRSLVPKSAAMIWGVDVSGKDYRNYGSVKQEVDVTDVDTLFFDFGGFTYYAPTSTASAVRIYVNGVKQFDSFTLPETSGLYNGWSYYGYAVDVSGFSGVVDVEVRLLARASSTTMGRTINYAWVSRVSSYPTWYDEPPSATRSKTRAFPEVATLVVDDAGLSILDSFKYAEDGTAQPELWLRWDIRPSLAPFTFTSVSASEGKIYLGSTAGLIVLDFPNDRIERYDSTGHYQFTGIGHREDVAAGILTQVEPGWRTVSTASAYTLPESDVTCVATLPSVPGGWVVGGTQQGAFALISGTIYKSSEKYPVSSVACSGDSVVVGFYYGKDSTVACMWDSANLGTASFEYDSYLTSNQDLVFNDIAGSAIRRTSSFFNVSSSGTVTTISGTSTTLDSVGQRAALYLSDHRGPSPVLINADIRIREWPADCPGELRLGLAQNVGVQATESLSGGTAGVYMAARNGFSVPMYSDNFLDSVVEEGNYLLNRFIGKYSAFEDASYGMVFPCNASYYFTNTRSTFPIGTQNFIVRFKVRTYGFSGTYSLMCNVADYTASPASGNSLQFIVQTSSTSPYYGIRSFGTPTSSWSTIPFFGDEGGGDSSAYHDVRLHFKSSTKTMVAYVDNTYVGTATLGTLGTAYLTFTTPVPAGTGTGSIFMVKEFSIDFYDHNHTADTRKYSVGRISGVERTPEGSQYIWGDNSNPYKSDITRSFFGEEGTENEEYRRWSLFYDPTGGVYSCYVGGTFIGAGSVGTALPSPGVFLDAQFFPVTTQSGSGTLVVDIDNFSVEYGRKSILGLPLTTFSGTHDGRGAVRAVSISESNVVSFSEPQPAQQDSVVLVGSDGGMTSINVGVPNYNVDSVQEKFTFLSGGVPAQWSVADMPGHSGASSWAVSSGTLKQEGSIVGHGASLSSSDKIRGPFGSHLCTSITTGYTPGNYVSAVLRTTNTGTYGLGFNTLYNTEGTITVASGSYIVFGQEEMRCGEFSSSYNSVGPSYDASYTVTFSGTTLRDHKTGVIVEVGALTTTSGVDVYVDGSYKCSLPVSSFPAQGGVSLISNGNTFSEFRFVGEIRSELFTYPQQTRTYSDVLYGSSTLVAGVLAQSGSSRTSGIFLAGTTDSGTDVIWVKHPWSVVPAGTTNHMRCLVADQETGACYATAYTAAVNMHDYQLASDQRGWAPPTVALPLARNAAAYNATGHSGPWYYTIGVPGVLFLSPEPHKYLYVLSTYSSLGIVDPVAEEIVRWGSKASSIFARLLPYNAASRQDGFGTWFNTTTSYGVAAAASPRAGTPVFHWGLGGVVVGSVYGGIGKVRFIILYPDKAHAWSWAPCGEGSYSFDSFAVPPFAITTATQPNALAMAYIAAVNSLYFFDTSGVWVLRGQTNGWEKVGELPNDVAVSDVARTVVCSGSESLGKIFVHYGSHSAIYVFDILSDEWVPGFIGTPFAMGAQHNWLSFDDRQSRLYVLPATTTPNVYMSTIRPSTKGVYYSVEREPGVLPEASRFGRFLWQGPEAYVPSSDVLDPSSSIEGAFWKPCASGTNYPSPFESTGYVGSATGCVRVYSKSQTYGSVRAQFGGLSTRVAVPTCSFSATIDARVPQLTQHSSGKNHYCLFGISSGASAPAHNTAYHEPGLVTGAIGYDGIYMGAVNNVDYGGSRYMLVKRDVGTWSNTATTAYSAFVGNDGTWTSEFKQWGISYDYYTSTLTASISGTIIGSLALTNGIDKMFLEIGCGGAWAGSEGALREHTLEAKNFTVDFNNGVPSRAASNDVLTIDKGNYDNGTYGYKRILPTLSSGSNYAYETRVSCSNYSIRATPYVFSLGRINDGYRLVNLCAVEYNGARRVGFWSGLNPWTTSSGFPTLYTHEWQDESVYSILREGNIISVCINGESIDALRTDYSTFPRSQSWFDKSISFGVDELPEKSVSVIDCSLDQYAGGPVSASGTWTRTNHATTTPTSQTSWTGSKIYHTTSPGSTDRTLSVAFPEHLTGEVYVYYQAGDTLASYATNTPITIYSTGVFETPVADSYSTNNINTVSLNTDHLGAVATGAVTIRVNDRLTNTGKATTGCHQGLVYLGKYYGATRAVITPDANGTVMAGTFFLYEFDPSARLRNKSRTSWKYVRFEADTASLVAPPECGTSFVDNATGTVIDYYGEATSPALTDGRVGSISEV